MKNKVHYSNLLAKTDDELKNMLSHLWGIPIEDLNNSFKVIATYKKASKKDVNGHEYGYFEDVRSLNGDILYYPYKYGKVRIFTPHRDSFMSNDFWQVNVKVASKSQREKHKNPFMIAMNDAALGKPKLSFGDKLKKEKLIKKIFEETGSTARDAKNTSNALHAIMGDLYTETERFIFELLQNADDQPEAGKIVKVKLKTLDENLLFLHTGKPFTEDDVESISSIGDSTKKKDTEKIGYKGIGFKSVFSDADTVYIDSGNFSFAFDKNSPLYSGNANMDEIPWQIKPIWEEKYRLPKEVQKEDLYFSAPVGIALNVGSTKIETYNDRITQLLSKPQFTLFLRNVGEISFESKGRETIIRKEQVENSGIVRITSNGICENWIMKDYIIDIPIETKDAIQNEKLIPAKLKEATKTKISFAAKVENDTIRPIDNAVLFTYLPTKVNDFGFKFLVNADFLTTASREQIHSKNIWNRFLFTQIGHLLLDWVANLKGYNCSLSILPTKTYDTENLLINDFYNSLKQSLSEVPFVWGHKGNMLSIKDIMLDKSGISHIIGKDLFCSIVNPSKSLPCDDSDSEVLKNLSLVESIESHSTLSVLEKLTNNPLFTKWFLDANEEAKKSFFTWLVENNTEKRKTVIELLVANLPIYKFGDTYLNKKQVEADSNKFIIRSPHAVLKPIFEACGYECSDNIDDLPISIFYSDNIIKSTFAYIFGHLSNRESFFKWLSNSSNEELKVFIDWLQYQDKINHNTISEFVETLPIIQFDDISTTKQAAILDATRIIVTSKTESIKPILMKIGFKCSENLELSPFVSLISLPKEIDSFNKIKEKTSTAPLCPKEKIELFRTLKQLEGVNETSLSQILLFSNQTNSHRKWLSIMTAYSADLPRWMYKYAINEKENFEDLQPYLVKKERIFEEILKPNIDEILKDSTFKDLYIAYKKYWTFGFTQTVINKYGTTPAVLEMVVEQDNDSKRYFLQKIERIEINLDEVYDKSSKIYRELSLAFEVLNDDELRKFSSRLWVGERTLSSFMVSDEISFNYHEGKLIHLPLIKLLPSYTDTEVIQRIKNTLSAFDTPTLNRLLVLTPMSPQDVWQKIDKKNNFTPYSYLLGIYCTRKCHGWYGDWVPYMNLEELTDTWISELLSILYNQKVELSTDCFGYRLSSYFMGYISNDYVNEDETILRTIEKWADTEDKLAYIVGLGVKTERTRLVKFRKSLVNNEPLSSDEIESMKDNITSTFNFLKSKNFLPFHENNQIAAMLALELYSKEMVISVDKEKLSANSIEYSLPEYENWKQTNSITIFLHDGPIPYQLKRTDDDELLICSFDRDNFYYDSSTNILYINKSYEIRDTLYSVVSNNSIPFSAEDWQKLFYDNLVSKSEVEKCKIEIASLNNELEEYRKRYGTLPKKNEGNEKIGDNEPEIEDSIKKNEVSEENNTTIQPNNSKLQDVCSPQLEDLIERGGLSHDEQVAAHKEAENIIKMKLENDGYDCSNWNLDTSNDKQWCSFNQVEDIVNPEGETINIIIKSAKGGYIYLSAADFDFLTSNSKNLLMVWDGINTPHSVTAEDIFNKDSNVNLIFDTEYTPKHYYAALSKVFQYIKRTTFAVKNPSYNAYDTIKSFGMDSKTEGVQELFDDNDL